jgi:hypothetical protein
VLFEFVRQPELDERLTGNTKAMRFSKSEAFIILYCYIVGLARGLYGPPIIPVRVRKA